MQKLLISAIVVTKNNGELIKYSIESIVNYIDEILIYDDSDCNDKNLYLCDLEKYNNVKIINHNHDFGTDLGKKKEYLNIISKNNIILRWDNDFILYDYQLLSDVYNLFIENKIDICYGFANLNLKFDLNKLDYDQYFCAETYIFRKGFIKFGKYDHYSDYPIAINKNSIYKKFPDKILFIHLNNFKSIENSIFRCNMNHFFNSGLKNYFEYLYIKENPNSTYDFNDIINYKKQKICHFKNYIYKYNKDYDKQYDWFKNVNEININYDPLNLNTRFIDYINKSFIFKKINDNEYIFERNETDNITKLFYHYNSNINTGNFGDIISYYLFEKLTGYQHVYYDIANTHYDDYHYIINGNIINNKSIIWGFGINNLYLNKNKNINQYKIYCVRGKNTRKLLLENDINIDEKYGDPILIMPLLYNKKVNKIYNYGIILDINDNEFINNYFGTLQNIKIINLIIQKDNNSIENLIDIINSCEIIVSSSLCGIIISHAYNIPVIRFKQSCINEDEINFLDYFESVYSYYYETTYDITYVISNIDEIIKKYKKPDMIKYRQIDLINSCPFIDNCLKNMLIKMII